MTSIDEAPTGSALRLVLTAERLFAVHGIDGVSLRQISTESGSSNNSAVHYHFGSKDGLVEAIFQFRIPQLLHERRLLHAQGDPSDLRHRFSAQYLPLLHMADAPDNRYVSFVEQLQRRGMAAGTQLSSLPAEGRQSDETFRTEIAALLPDHPDEVRRMRITGAQLACIHAAVDREHAIEGGTPVAPFELFVSSLLDGIVGFLLAPASPRTRQLCT